MNCVKLRQLGHRARLPYVIQAWLEWQVDRHFGVPDKQNPKPWPWKKDVWVDGWQRWRWRRQELRNPTERGPCLGCGGSIFISRKLMKRAGHEPGIIYSFDKQDRSTTHWHPDCRRRWRDEESR